MTSAFAVLFLALACMHAFGVSWTEAVGEPVMIATALAAIVLRLVRTTASGAKRFWFFIVVSHVAYLSVFTFNVDWVGEIGARLGLLEDLLILMFYAAVFFAITCNPHLRSHQRADFGRRRIETLGAIVFSAGLFTYFILIPVMVGTDGVESYAPSILAYVLLDIALVTSFLYLRGISRAPAWRATYGLLACTHGAWAMLDLCEALMWLDVIPYTEGIVDCLWYLPHLATIRAAGADVRHVERVPGERVPVEVVTRQFGLGIPITVFLVLAPTIHFGLYAFDILDAESRGIRELNVLVTVALLAGLAVVGQRRQARDHRRFEAHLRQSQKMDAIGRLAGGIAHDINNVLTVIFASSELALERLPKDAAVRPDIENIFGAGRRAGRLTSQLLALGRKQPLEMQALDLNELVADLSGMLRRVVSAHIALDFKPANRPCVVRADRNQLEQVLLNLALNARDAMPEGGQLVLETHLHSKGTEASLPPDTSGPYASIVVRDTGSGMDEPTLHRAFDPFFTTKEIGKGVGLGLSTAYGIVKQHGGELVVSSRPGQGTTMTIFLPAFDVTDETYELPTTRVVSAVGDETILVVEDESDVREVVRRTLELRGYEVLTAENATAARSLFALHRTRVSLLLTDVVMPGESGPQLYVSLAADRPDLKVLFMTGYSSTEVFPNPDARHPVVSKPFETDELCEAVREVLDSGRSSADAGSRGAEPRSRAADAQTNCPVE